MLDPTRMISFFFTISFIKNLTSSVHFDIFPECTVEQKDAGCCESDAFTESSGGNIEWIKKDNGNGGKWITEPDFIQFNIADDSKCNGNQTFRQTGNATLTFDNSESTLFQSIGHDPANEEVLIITNKIDNKYFFMLLN